VEVLERAGIGAAHQVPVGDRVVGAGGVRNEAPLRPFELDRRDRQEERAGEIAARPDAGIRDRFLRGSTGTKSIVPAMRVFKPSVAKRVMAWMPDSPAVSLRQLSAVPMPSEVTAPMPVTTTIGRPA
jgi:hypothetical protein